MGKTRRLRNNGYINECTGLNLRAILYAILNRMENILYYGINRVPLRPNVHGTIK